MAIPTASLRSSPIMTVVEAGRTTPTAKSEILPWNKNSAFVAPLGMFHICHRSFQPHYTPFIIQDQEENEQAI